MIPRFDLHPRVFSALAAGHGDAAAVRLLRNVRLSENLLLLRYIRGQVGDRCEELTAALAVLSRAQRSAPEVVDDLLVSPWVGVWAVHCARSVRHRGRLTPALRTDLAYLAAVAAVAAARSGVDADLPARPRAGRLVLPSLGAVVPGPADPAAGPTRVRVRAGTISVHTGDRQLTVPAGPHRCGAAPAGSGGPGTTVAGSGRPAVAHGDAGWLAMRRLDATCDGLRLVVALDDLDPFRNCYARRVTGRLGAQSFRRWQSLFSQAWELLVRHVPDRARELSAGLAALVPLASPPGGPGLSATSEDAFGGLGLTRPVSGAELAATLVHELQHSKLGALWRLVPLYDRGVRGGFYAPWRTDPRPLGGLLQGAYAFLGVTDVWGRLRTASAATDTAVQEFANLREQVGQVLDTLAGSGGLTAAGQLFLTHMRGSLERLRAEPVPAGVARRARAMLRENQAAWRRRHGSGHSGRPAPGAS